MNKIRITFLRMNLQRVIEELYLSFKDENLDVKSFMIEMIKENHFIVEIKYD